METFRKSWFSVVLGILCLYAVWLGSASVRSSFSSADKPSSIYGWDTSFYYFWLRSIALDFDVDFANEIELCDSLPWKEKRFALERIGRTEKDLVPNKYPIGWAVFHLPWFYAGHGVSHILDTFGWEVRTDGFGKVYEGFVYVGSLFYAGLSLWLSYLLLRRFFEIKFAANGLAVVWLSGFLLYYQLGQYAMAHSLTYLCVVAVFYATVAIQEFPPLKRNWVILGVATGLLLITRYQAGVYLLFPFCVAAWLVFRRTVPLQAVVACLASLFAIVGLQLIAWKALYGSWLVYSYKGEGFNWESPEIWNSLFSPLHGLVYWHPVFLVGVVGLLGFLIARRNLSLWLWPITCALVVYVNAAWEVWWFGASFGGRAYEGVTLFMCFGVAWLLAVSEGWKFGFGVLLKLGLLGLVFWNLAVLEVCTFNWKSGISLEGPVTYADFWRAIGELWF